MYYQVLEYNVSCSIYKCSLTGVLVFLVVQVVVNIGILLIDCIVVLMVPGGMCRNVVSQVQIYLVNFLKYFLGIMCVCVDSRVVVCLKLD